MRWKFLLAMDLLNVFAFAFWGPLFTLYAVHLGANTSEAASLYAIYVAVHAIANLYFGHIDKPHQRIAFISSGFLIQAVCAIIFVLIDKPIWLVIPLATSAIAGGMIAPMWKALYSRSIEVNREAKSWAWYDAGEAGVLAAGAAIAGVMANYIGYKTIFIPLGLLNLAAALLCLRLPNLKNT
jgi:MFS family permease